MRRAVVRQRLELDDMAIEQTMPADGPLAFRCTSFGVVHVRDSSTGKRAGDADVFPWHRVVELRTWRQVVEVREPTTSQPLSARGAHAAA